jgi:hypothetical protein
VQDVVLVRGCSRAYGLAMAIGERRVAWERHVGGKCFGGRDVRRGAFGVGLDVVSGRARDSGGRKRGTEASELECHVMASIHLLPFLGV